jgi:hypothetical protein
VFTDETADSMLAEPKADVMEAGTDLPTTTRTIDTNYAGAGGAAAGFNASENRAGRAAPIYVGKR